MASLAARYPALHTIAFVGSVTVVAPFRWPIGASVRMPRLATFIALWQRAADNFLAVFTRPLEYLRSALVPRSTEYLEAYSPVPRDVLRALWMDHAGLAAALRDWARTGHKASSIST